MILQFSEEKWDDMISSGKSLGEILFENDTEKRNALDIEFNKKNRVTVAQFASKEAIANTPRSPRSNNSISHSPPIVNRELLSFMRKILEVNHIMLFKPSLTQKQKRCLS